MFKKDFVDVLLEESRKDGEHYTRKQMESLVELFPKVIIDAVKRGEFVQLTGFGTFAPKDSAEREGRNPKTKEPITIKASRSVKFKPGKEAKDL